MNRAHSPHVNADGALPRLQPRDWILIGLVLASWVATALAGPIRQPQAYYLFADRRAMLGIPNFCDVTTNLPFLFIGLAGWAWGFTERARALNWSNAKPLSLKKQTRIARPPSTTLIVTPAPVRPAL